MRPEASTIVGTYTGIGASEPSDAGYSFGHKLAFYLAKHGFRLRSGGARGMDTAWALGAGLVTKDSEIFLPQSVPAWCYEEVVNYLDPGCSLSTMRPVVRDLLARNMQQVLGRDGNAKSMFVLYWTKTLDGADKNAGGTRYAVRCAKAHGIPTLNILDSDLSSVLAWVTNLL